jgi:hypothetical protein
MIDGAKLILVNVLVVCLLVPVMERFGGRSLPPGVDMIFFWVGAVGLAALGLLWLGLLRGRRERQ